MNKRKKVILTSLMIFLLIATILTIYFLKIPRQSFAPISNIYSTASLISEDSNKAIYSYSFLGDQTNNALDRCNPTSQPSYEFTIPCNPTRQSALPKLADNLKQINVFVEAYDIEMGGISVTKDACSDISTTETPIFLSKKAECKINPDIVISGEQRACMICKFSGQFGNTGVFSGFSGGSLRITFLKNTCEEKWQCSEYANCIGGKQIRTCLDSNSCGTTTNKPEVEKSCQIVIDVPVNITEPSTSQNLIAKDYTKIIVYSILTIISILAITLISIIIRRRK